MSGGAKLVTAVDASSAQTRMWFLDQMLPTGSSYHVTRAIDLDGELQVACLEQAVRECVQRHEILRTCFKLVGGGLRQIITHEEPRLRLVDLRGVPADVTQLIKDAAADPFNLKRAPLVRVHLLRPAENRHVLIFVFHHIVVDAWSLDMVIREVADIYHSRVTGRPYRGRPPRLQYADYAAWQRRALDGGGIDEHLAYWLEQTEDLPHLELFSDRPPPAVRTHHGGLQHFTLDPGLIQRLNTLAKQEGATPFMVLLAAFTVLMHRCTGQDEIVLGGTSPARHRPELQEMIGFFVNMLVLRTQLAGANTLRDALRRTIATCQDAYDHQDAPFERLVELRGGPRDSQQHPFFQVVFQMINVETELELPGLDARFRQPEPAPAMFDLVFTVETNGGYVEYAMDLYDGKTVAQFTKAWIVVLEEFSRDPDQAMGGFPLVHVQRAATGVDTYVVDKYLHPVPPGFVGQLVGSGHPARLHHDGTVEPVMPDRQPAPTDTAPTDTGTTDPPSGPVEETLGGIWSELLNRSQIGRNDNFFVLGGHSLLATVLMTTLQDRFGVELSLEEFFQRPTIAGTARAITDRKPPETAGDVLADLLEDLT